MTACTFTGLRGLTDGFGVSREATLDDGGWEGGGAMDRNEEIHRGLPLA